ncbi:MAG: glycosyltransferase [Clostridia bacterium]|nr:glycosyltransferase [Clostridia bacterium]
MERPFFSVITVCFNAGDALKSTALQLAEQTCGDYEHIIKDGGSTDGSVSHLPSDPRIKLISCPDGGIYDAMNQAISTAKGRFIFFLNCGDLLKDTAILEEIRNFILKNLPEDGDSPDSVVYGNCILGDTPLRQPSKLSKAYLYRRPLVHQTMFFGSGVFNAHGDFDTSIKIRADHEITLRALCGGTEFLHIDRVICIYQRGGYSEKPENREIRSSELARIRGKYYTEREQKKYRLLQHLTLSKLRGRIASNGSPSWLRRLYARVSNIFNR